MAEDERRKRRKRQRQNRKNKRTMSKKLEVLTGTILLAFGGLIFRLYQITNENQNEYQKIILSQQQYDSTTIPFKRGTITDKNGTILAVSEKVYNVVLDCKVMLDSEYNEEPTLEALSEVYGLDKNELEQYVTEHPSSQYYVLKKLISYDEMQEFLNAKTAYAKEVSKQTDSTLKEQMGTIAGVWFEEEYIRSYPYGSLACDVIGFTTSDSNGLYGLEEYYNDELNGTNGREYGFLNDDSTLERTTIPAVDGYSLVSTIDANIQQIVEKYIKQFNDEHENEYREGPGSTNTGVIVMNPNTGEILAMASYPVYDLNNPKDISAYYTEDEINQMKEDDTFLETCNKLWRNFCISDTYEPGSTAKSLTIATGLESGKLIGTETYECPGYLTVADRTIKCNLHSGHGTLTVSGALEQSCNVALMKMGSQIGASIMLKFEEAFNIGLKTNIDLAGEARTASLVFNESTMGETELATSSFGQGFNVTMIEMASAFSSIINGGYYYEPHMVSKITNSSGDTIENIEPRLLKQTISESTSEQMRAYLYAAVAQGTGKSARPAGYAIGGKTGTAEKAARDKENYVVSFIGFAPAVNPELVIYVVIDEPNVEDQPHATYAIGIAKNILTEVLPYLGIQKTEELTIGEQEEINNILNMVGEEYETKYAVDEETGELVDTETGEIADTTGDMEE